MRHFACVLPLCLAAIPVSLAAQVPPTGFETPDHDIRIGVQPGLLRYDTEQFSVGKGSKVKLTLVNTDAMQHNLLICRRGAGVTERVAAAAIKLAAQASKHDYVPDTPDVMFHTKAIYPEQSDTIWFQAPDEDGDYPYICTLPGHTFTMVGVMHVGQVEEVAEPLPIQQLRYRLFKGSWKVLPNFDSLPPNREGALEHGLIDLAQLQESSQFGACFTGVLVIEKAGSHTFFLNSDDGSRLFIDGKMVVEYDGLHGPAKEQKGTVDLTAARHAVRVDYFQGGGGKALRLAYEGPQSTRRPLSTRNEIDARVIPIAVHHHPVVMRVHVEGAAARTIAVGLPGGMNYCFDAQDCCVQFGWAGAYLDVGPDREDRGGRPCKVLGQRFAVGTVGFPLRTVEGRERPARFTGYRTRELPQFSIDWGGTEVLWTIAPAPLGVGLQYTFAMPAASQAVQFAIDTEGLEVASSAGIWRGGLLTVPAEAAREFTVTLTTTTGGQK